MNISVIITAGGVGERFGMMKQFIPINGIPVFIHTINKFKNTEKFKHMVLTVPPQFKEIVTEMLASHGLKTKVDVIEGGDTRQKSIHNGLKWLAALPTSTAKVVVTDANRPCISIDSINKFVKKLESCDALVSVCRSINTTCTSSNGKIVDDVLKRENMYEMLMPQGFSFDLLLEAHNKYKGTTATDDLQVIYELQNVDGQLFEMDYWEGLKLTYPADYKIFKKLIKGI